MDLYGIQGNGGHTGSKRVDKARGDSIGRAWSEVSEEGEQALPRELGV